MSNSSSSSCAAGEISIKLTRHLTRDYPINDGFGFRLRVVASDGCGLENEIFRYYQQPAEEFSGDVKSVGSGVCTWPEMEDLPVGAPADEAIPQAFRLAEWDQIYGSAALADEVWDILQDHTQKLLNAIDRGQTLEVQESVTITPETDA